MTEVMYRPVDHECWRIGLGKIGFGVLEMITIAAQGVQHPRHPRRVAAPGLIGVVWRPRMDHHLGSRSQEIVGNGESDPGPTADAGHHDDPSRHPSNALHDFDLVYEYRAARVPGGF